MPCDVREGARHHPALQALACCPAAAVAVVVTVAVAVVAAGPI